MRSIIDTDIKDHIEYTRNTFTFTDLPIFPSFHLATRPKKSLVLRWLCNICRLIMKHLSGCCVVGAYKYLLIGV